MNHPVTKVDIILAIVLCMIVRCVDMNVKSCSEGTCSCQRIFYINLRDVIGQIINCQTLALNYILTLEAYLTDPQSLATKPVAMPEFVGIAVQGELVEGGV